MLEPWILIIIIFFFSGGNLWILCFCTICYLLISLFFISVDRGCCVVLEKDNQYIGTLQSGPHCLSVRELPKSFRWARREWIKDGSKNHKEQVLQGIQIPIEIQSFDLQEYNLFTEDKIPVSIKVILFYKVINPHDVIYKIDNLWQHMELTIDAAIQTVVMEIKHNFIHHSRRQMTDVVQREVSNRFSEWGISMIGLKFESIVLHP